MYIFTINVYNYIIIPNKYYICTVFELNIKFVQYYVCVNVSCFVCVLTKIKKLLICNIFM